MDHAPSGNCSGLGAVGLKSLAPYRERRGRKFSHNGKKTRAAALSIGGDLKEVADSIRYGATIDSLCNEGFAGESMALREGNSALHSCQSGLSPSWPAATGASRGDRRRRFRGGPPYAGS